jgi:hypothetical protein
MRMPRPFGRQWPAVSTARDAMRTPEHALPPSASTITKLWPITRSAGAPPTIADAETTGISAQRFNTQAMNLRRSRVRRRCGCRRRHEAAPIPTFACRIVDSSSVRGCPELDSPRLAGRQEDFRLKDCPWQRPRRQPGAGAGAKASRSGPVQWAPGRKWPCRSFRSSP